MMLRHAIANSQNLTWSADPPNRQTASIASPSRVIPQCLHINPI
jgi:hypothetical protein